MLRTSDGHDFVMHERPAPKTHRILIVEDEPDIAASLDRVVFWLFDLELVWGRAKRIDPYVALASLLAHAGIAVLIVVWQVRRAHLRGIGGAS